MLYLQLPPSDGALANTLKENLLAHMIEKKVGLLHACEALDIPKQRAFVELKADKVFGAAIEEARELLAEYWHEEAVEMADKAKGREDTPAVTLKVKTRLQIAEQILPRLKQPGNKSLHLHQHQGDTFYISEEKREELQAQRARLMLGHSNASAPRDIATSEALGSTEQTNTPDAVARRTDEEKDLPYVCPTGYAESVLSDERKNVRKSEAPPEGGVG